MSATMKLDELMAGLDEFLNAPPTKRKKVFKICFKRSKLIFQVEVVFEDEPKEEPESGDSVSDSDVTDVSDTSDSESE